MIKHSRNNRQGKANLSLIFLLLAFSILLAGSWLAFNQAPRQNPYTPTTLSDKFLYPIENNAFQRLAKFSTSLNDVFALPDSQQVWAVGGDGLIIHSIDGGLSWHQQQFPKSSKTTGNIQSSSGNQQQAEKRKKNNKNISQEIEQKAVQTQQAEVDVAVDLKAIYFTDAQRGWAVGDYGTILFTDNGGETWQAQSSTTDVWLTSVTFSDAQHGWAVGW